MLGRDRNLGEEEPRPPPAAIHLPLNLEIGFDETSEKNATETDETNECALHRHGPVDLIDRSPCWQRRYLSFGRGRRRGEGSSFYGRSLNDALNRDRKVDEFAFFDRSRFESKVFTRNYYLVLFIVGEGKLFGSTRTNIENIRAVF